MSKYKPKKYRVPVKFIFEGEFIIMADSREEAKERIEKNTGLCIGGEIHTTEDPFEIDWNFNTHSDKEIGRIKKL